MKRLIATLVALLVMASCSPNDLAEQGEKSRAGKNRKNEAGAKREGKDKGPGGSASENGGKGGDIEGEIDAAAPGAGSGAEAPQDFGGGDAPSSGIDPSLARASASMEDSTSDARSQGIAPSYTEATGVSIQGLGENVRFTMTFGGTVPDQVQKDEYMVLAFGVTGRKEGEGYALGATCDERGWTPYAGAKGENQEFPGKFTVDGNQIVMELSWSFIRGPRAFEYYASTGWYRKVVNQTHWSFDSVPNEKAGNFPG